MSNYDEDENDYDDDDTLDEEDLNDEELDGDDLSTDDESGDDDETDENSIQAHAEALAKKNKALNIVEKKNKKIYPKVSASEARVLRAGISPKEYAKYKIKWQTKRNVVSNVLKIVLPVVPYLLIFLIVLLAVLAVAGQIDNVFGDGSNGSTGMSASESAVNGEKFYGNRVIYRDDEQASADMLSQYVEIVRGAVNNVPIDHTEYTLSIKVEFPSDYDYKSFDEETFASTYPALYQILAGGDSGFVDVVYKADNPEGTATTLSEQLSEIKYFGLTNTMLDSVNNTVKEYVTRNGVVGSGEIDGATYVATAKESYTVNITAVNSMITEKVDSYFATMKAENLGVRTEKLYVKDFIFSSSDDRMQGIAKQDYVAMIFMPKMNVAFDKFSFYVDSAKNFDIHVESDGQNYTFTSEEIDVDLGRYLYTSNENLAINASVFADIDTNNLDFLKDGKSLQDIVYSLDIDYNIYLEPIVAESETGSEVEGGTDSEVTLLTVKKNGVKVMFRNDDKFAFAENETVVK